MNIYNLLQNVANLFDLQADRDGLNGHLAALKGKAPPEQQPSQPPAARQPQRGHLLAMLCAECGSGGTLSCPGAGQALGSPGGGGGFQRRAFRTGLRLGAGRRSAREAGGGSAS